MTEKLWMKDSYLKEWDAAVQKASEGRFVVLDRTAFYPASGGQPSDSGKMIDEKGNEFQVVFAKQFGQDISHEVKPLKEGAGLQEGSKVHCVLDWNRRHKLMRMHSAAHILSSVIFKELGSLITGNQLDVDKSRIDFNVKEFDQSLLAGFESKANEVVQRKLEQKIEFMPYAEAMKLPELFRLKDVLPKNIPELRIVSIGDFDRQADGGTHVKNTGEIGRIRLVKFENKGAENRRIYFTVEP
jgi:misacylated tRNA(Ala) deacylase